MWGALEEMQNIIGQLHDLKEQGRRIYQLNIYPNINIYPFINIKTPTICGG